MRLNPATNAKGTQKSSQTGASGWQKSKELWGESKELDEFTINPKQPRGAKGPHWHILLYNFLVNHLNLMKFDDFSWNLSGANILNLSSKFEQIFAESALSHDQLLFFVNVFCWNNEYITENIRRIWTQKV